MTTSSEFSDRILTEELGISGYIVKPLNYRDNTKEKTQWMPLSNSILEKFLPNPNHEYRVGHYQSMQNKS